MSTINKQLFKFVLSRPSLLKFLLETTNFEKYPIIQNARNYIIAKSIEGIYTAGETLYSVKQQVETLEKRNIGTILNYVKESAGVNELKHIESEQYRILDFLKLHPSSCVALKPTSLIEPKNIISLSNVLALHSQIYPNINLNELISSVEVQKVSEPLFKLAEEAYKYNSRILIDAEQSSLQPAVDLISLYLMNIFNKRTSIIYNTYQLYLEDSPIRIFHHQNWLKQNNSFFAAKIVRGAYLSYERNVQNITHTNYRLCPTKAIVDQHFDETVSKLISDDYCDLIIASHNLDSLRKIKDVAKRKCSSTSAVVFAYLMGFEEKVNDAVYGFDRLEYVPYGPIDAKIPYLLRRLEENLTV